MSQQVKTQNRIDLRKWQAENKGDPALKNFVRKLKTHLLLRILGETYDSDEHDFSDKDLEQIIIDRNVIYRHKVLRVNYTTYDLRRQQDSINPRTHADIMILSHETDVAEGQVRHPYWYARVLGIFHCRVLHKAPGTNTLKSYDMEFLWIRWYGLDRTRKFGFQAKQLPRVGFVDEKKDKDLVSFGFLDPSQVIRAVHLIPDDVLGRSDNLGATFVRSDEDGLDWNYFFVNIFVDRDMFMRYRGGAAGHEAIREAVDHFLGDRDQVDLRYHNEHEKQIEELAELEDTAEELQNDKDKAEWATTTRDDGVGGDDEDYGYTRKPDEDDDGELDEAGYGPEDGEGGEGELSALGYADL
ncbi:hypothetical protein EST38_g12061 [Candolleomyces aberdarensis]|uniref:Uncharacterized protein n=1 Tax=Candolleomyces aberdarensis TaxID=2316362 RepID=A0A4Q2D5Y6_9AGAR|nr:hypothetical protein EST38_g12061 [Candolleomyces aberdarensis]